MTTDAQFDIDMSPVPDSWEPPAPSGCEQPTMDPPAGPGGSSLLAFTALLLTLLGTLGIYILIFQPFADQVGGCGGG